MKLSLPWPPSVNHYYRRVGHRTLISKPGRLYRQMVVGQLRPRFPVAMTGRLAVTIHAHPPDRRRRDLDNILKCTLDSLQHAGIYGDDSQIDSLTIHRRDPVTNGIMHIQIHES